MKAVQITEFGGPEVLKTVEINEPSPNAQEVKVKVYAVGLNPNEAYTITGTYGFKVPDLPYVPGYDATGVVEEVGQGVEQFKQGDRVFVSAFSARRNTGTYAEKVVVDAENVFKLPDRLSFKKGAALGIPAFTAYKALFLKAKIKAGETVLIHGASGAVGHLAVQMAKTIGAIVIGTSSTKEGRQMILDIGADYALEHISKDNKEKLAGITDGKGPDIIIEMLANANLETDLQTIQKGGRIIVVGSRDNIEINPRHLMVNESTVMGMNFTYPTKEEMNELSHGVEAFFKIGAIHPVIGSEFTLDEPKKAHQALMEASGNGRTVFVVAEE